MTQLLNGSKVIVYGTRNKLCIDETKFYPRMVVREMCPSKLDYH